ncbi:MAG TPA: hypothetical protein VF523_08405, partial [Burkholderiales bacterium]
CFPVLDDKLKKRVVDESLKTYLADVGEAWEMDGEGRYQRKKVAHGKRQAAQAALLDKLASPAAPS